MATSSRCGCCKCHFSVDFMSNLTPRERRKLEDLFGMSSGYVLDFSNPTFARFFDMNGVGFISDIE